MEWRISFKVLASKSSLCAQLQALLSALLVFSFIGQEQVAYAAVCTVSWSGAAGDGLWQTPVNWSAGSVPGSTDDACIPSGTNVTLSSVSQSIHSFTSDSPLTITS